MKLHPDGTIEGTPEEVAAYKREMVASEEPNTPRKRRMFIRQPYPLPALKIVEIEDEDEWRGFDGRFRTL